jgi:trehalose-phosphatase
MTPKRTPGIMKHLFHEWEIIRQKVQEARRIFLFLDFDGTLSPIVARPEQAVCSPEVKALLEQLGEIPGVSVAIVSGRSLCDIRKRVGIPGILYIGNHGLEVQEASGTCRRKTSPNQRKELEKIALILQEKMDRIPGLLFEDKGPILAVHYRNTPPGWEDQILARLEEAAKPWAGRWRIAQGKKVLEIQPDMDFGKGRAVEEVLACMGKDLLPIFVGDDRTDEDGFSMMKGRGIGIRVGRPEAPSEAEYYLADPAEVVTFLQRCLEIRQVSTRLLKNSNSPLLPPKRKSRKP